MSATLTPFQFLRLPVRGRLLTLPNLSQHIKALQTPTPATTPLSHLLAATALLAHDAQKLHHTQTEPVAPGTPPQTLNVSIQLQHAGLGALLWARSQLLPGGATFLKAHANPAATGTPFTSLVHQPGGILAVTLENPNNPAARYQSLVPLTVPLDDTGTPLAPPSIAGLLTHYFNQSVQTPTHLVIHTHQQDGQQGGQLHAGALLLQALPGETLPADDWTRLGLLAATLQPEEITSDSLSHTTLLQRLFVEDLDTHGLEVFPAQHPTLIGPDPRPAMLAALAALPPEELAALLEKQEALTLTDETSGEAYTFSAAELATLATTPPKLQ